MTLRDYASAEEKCEQKPAVLIEQMKKEIAAEKEKLKAMT